MIINSIEWIFSHKRRVLWLTILIVILLSIFHFVTTYAVLLVKVESSSAAKNIVVYASSETKTTKAQNFGMTIIPRDTKNLIVTSGDYMRTQTKITIPWYGIVEKKVSLKQDRDADKVAYNSTQAATCASYMPSSDQLAYYSCTNPKALLSYQAPESGRWATKKIANLYYSSNPVRPYLGGVIGISHTPSSDVRELGDITVVTEAGKTVPYEIPAGLLQEDLINTRIFTDRNNPTNKRFVLVNPAGEIFIGTPTSGTQVDYDHIAAPPKYSKDRNETLCVLTDTHTYCYRGPSAVGDVPKSFDFNSVTPSQILSYSFDSKSSSVTDTAEKFFAINGFYVNRDGKKYIRKDGALFRLVQQGGKYISEQIAQGVSTAVGGDTLHYVYNNGVFVVDPNDPTTSYQIFYSPKIFPKAIYTIGDKVFMIATRKGSDTVTYAYQLNNSLNSAQSKRLIDIVPIDKSQMRNTYFSDLVGDRMYISLSLSNRSPSREQFDLEFAQKKENILNYFNSYDVSVDESKITFGY